MQHLQPNTTLQGGKYRIERVLGQGGFGNTYIATNTIFDDHVAIKEFFMQGVNDRDENSGSVTIGVESNTQQFDEQKEKFKKEARRLWKLKNEHIVKVHDLFEENGTAYYIMDYIDGESLAERLKRTGKPMSEQDIRKLLPQILDALKEVHQNEIWHLDLKPGNIMVDKQGNAYLIDFGASKQIRANGSMTTSTALCYTPGYAPNEQIGQMYDRFGPWTDIYALGATIYNLLTNKKPPMAIDIEEDEDGAFEFPMGVSENMHKLVVWMMQPKRKARPQTVDEVLAKLSTAKETQEKCLSMQDCEETIIIDSSPNYEDTLLASCKKTNEGINISQTVSPVIKELISNMIFVEGGTFMMGRKTKWYEASEEEEHQVTLSSYSINKYEVTQEEWEAVMGNNPSNFKGAKLPVEQVSWDDCQVFISKLNELTGMSFRLPTEAEWEYSARGGNKNSGCVYAGSNDLYKVAWYNKNSEGKSHEIGLKLPNELGLFDMCGNIREWCHDWYGDYGSLAQTDPQGSSTGNLKVIRGGGWDSSKDYCLLSSRDRCSPNYRNAKLGLRLAL